jgi:hypothetical protein
VQARTHNTVGWLSESFSVSIRLLQWERIVESVPGLMQVLQNLEAALSPQSSSVEQASLVSTLQTRIAAAESAGICYPLVRAAAVRLRTLQATDAHASLESAVSQGEECAQSYLSQCQMLKACGETRAVGRAHRTRAL